MNTVSRLVLVTTTVLATALSAGYAAQPSPAAAPAALEQKRADRLQRLDEKLHLSAEQKAKIEAAWAKAATELRTVQDNASLSRRERRSQVRQIMRATRAEVRTSLTPEQQKQFDALPRGRTAPPAAQADQEE